nr:uncharacterized protein LOC109158583 [Ipomoea trifida]
MLQNNSWNIPKLQDIIPDTFVDAIRAILIPLGDQNKDIIGWPNGEAGMFSVKLTYFCIASTNGDIKDWSWLWRLSCREKIKTFLCTTLKGRLLTSSERYRRHLTENNLCPYCGSKSKEETLKHLFWDCNAARITWRLTETPADFVFPMEVEERVGLQEHCGGSIGKCQMGANVLLRSGDVL